jgi:hypothetical protein
MPEHRLLPDRVGQRSRANGVGAAALLLSLL